MSHEERVMMWYVANRMFIWGERKVVTSMGKV